MLRAISKAFFFDPGHPAPFVSTSFVLNLLSFLFTFQPHSFRPKLRILSGGGKGEEKGNAVSSDAFLLGSSCFFQAQSMKPSYRQSLDLGSVATSEGNRAEEM